MCLCLRLLSILLVTAALPARASIAALAAKAYEATYPGPELPAEVAPVPAPTDPKTATIYEALRAWFVGEIRKDNEAIAGKLRKVDAGAYNSFLAGRRTKAQACAAAIPAELQADVTAFLEASDPAQQDSLVRKLAKATQKAGREVTECLDAVLVELDRRGVLVGGMVLGKTNAGIEQLKPVIVNPGLVYVLRPQVLTAWPGREESALGVLDPREGPWKVRLAHTYESKVETHNQKWKGKYDISVADYQKLTNNGHFLVVDGEGGALGWIDMDRVAFFHEKWAEEAGHSKHAYTTGIATFAHGVWWNPEGLYEGGPKGEGYENHQDAIWVNDFLTLVRLQTSVRPNPISDPYPRRMDVSAIRQIYEIDNVQRGHIIELMFERRGTPYEGWAMREPAGHIYLDTKCQLGYEFSRSSVRTTLQQIYR